MFHLKEDKLTHNVRKIHKVLTCMLSLYMYICTDMIFGITDYLSFACVGREGDQSNSAFVFPNETFRIGIIPAGSTDSIAVRFLEI